MWAQCDVAPRHFFRVIAQERRMGRQALARRWEAALVKLGVFRTAPLFASPPETVMHKPKDPAASDLLRVRRGDSVRVVRPVSSGAPTVGLGGATGNSWVDAVLERLLGPHLVIVPAALRGEFVQHVRDLVTDDPTMRRLVSRLRVAT